jgi:hypothetical protein
MWQAETFDTATIRRELSWASSIGLNATRVYLHHLAWEIDSAGFKKRLNTYLDIAADLGIRTIFVFFDDCWSPDYAAGKQPEPITGVHNSGWISDPGIKLLKDTAVYVLLEAYIKDVLRYFSQDERIVLWDLYNEPGNSARVDLTMPLLMNVFRWAREVNPSQPLTAGVWNKEYHSLYDFQLSQSDVISYHHYSNDTLHRQMIDTLRQYGRPLICTEYLARKYNSRFENIMPLLKSENVGAIHWGLVAGKTNTIYAWFTPMPDGKEPELWFHDIFRKDGTPFSEDEVTLIRSLTLDLTD